MPSDLLETHDLDVPRIQFVKQKASAASYISASDISGTDFCTTSHVKGVSRVTNWQAPFLILPNAGPAIL